MTKSIALGTKVVKGLKKAGQDSRTSSSKCGVDGFAPSSRLLRVFVQFPPISLVFEVSCEVMMVSIPVPSYWIPPL